MGSVLRLVAVARAVRDLCLRREQGAVRAMTMAAAARYASRTGPVQPDRPGLIDTPMGARASATRRSATTSPPSSRSPAARGRRRLCRGLSISANRFPGSSPGAVLTVDAAGASPRGGIGAHRFHNSRPTRRPRSVPRRRPRGDRCDRGDAASRDPPGGGPLPRRSWRAAWSTSSAPANSRWPSRRCSPLRLVSRVHPIVELSMTYHNRSSGPRAEAGMFLENVQGFGAVLCGTSPPRPAIPCCDLDQRLQRRERSMWRLGQGARHVRRRLTRCRTPRCRPRSTSRAASCRRGRPRPRPAAPAGDSAVWIDGLETAPWRRSRASRAAPSLTCSSRGRPPAHQAGAPPRSHRAYHLGATAPATSSSTYDDYRRRIGFSTPAEVSRGA